MTETVMLVLHTAAQVCYRLLFTALPSSFSFSLHTSLSQTPISDFHCLLFVIQGAKKLAEGARKVASNAKKMAGRVLNVVEDAGSLTAIARRVLSNLIDELHGSLSASVSAANKTFSRPRDRSSSSSSAAAADVQPPGVT